MATQANVRRRQFQNTDDKIVKCWSGVETNTCETHVAYFLTALLQSWREEKSTPHADRGTKKN